VGSEDAHAIDINVGAGPSVVVPRRINRSSVNVSGLEQLEKAPLREAPQPAESVGHLVLIVVPFDHKNRDICLPQEFEASDRLIHRLGLNATGVEKITSDEDEGDLLRDRISFDTVSPREEKVVRSFLRAITPDSKVDIGNVKEFCHVEPTGAECVPIGFSEDCGTKYSTAAIPHASFA
jgi:hypothetical protein